jgi:hypothetical protein
MPDHPTDQPKSLPRMLTRSARRIIAADMVHRANRAADGLLVADCLDVTAAGILKVSGVDGADTARAILRALWGEQ